MALTFSPFGLVGAFHPSGIDRPGQITPARVGSRTPVTSLSGGDLFKNCAIAIDSTTGLPTTTYTNQIVGTFLGVEFTNTFDGRRIVSPYLAASSTVFDPVFYVNVDPAMVYEAQLATNAGAPDTASSNAYIGDSAAVTTSGAAGFPIMGGAGTGLSRQFVYQVNTPPVAGNVLTIVDHGWDNVDSALWYDGTFNLFPTVRVTVKSANIQNS